MSQCVVFLFGLLISASSFAGPHHCAKEMGDLEKAAIDRGRVLAGCTNDLRGSSGWICNSNQPVSETLKKVSESNLNTARYTLQACLFDYETSQLKARAEELTRSTNELNKTTEALKSCTHRLSSTANSSKLPATNQSH